MATTRIFTFLLQTRQLKTLSASNSYYRHSLRYFGSNNGCGIENKGTGDLEGPSDTSNINGDTNSTPESTFEELINKSRLLTSCGSSPVGHIVMGKIIAIVDNDLYVDFGGKFHGVVPRPKEGGGRYKKGSLVEVKVKDLECTQHFLGHSRDTSLLEAEIELVGPLRKGRMNVLKSNTFLIF